MIAHTSIRATRSTLLADLALAGALALLIAGLWVALAWMAPLELVPPRVS